MDRREFLQATGTTMAGVAMAAKLGGTAHAASHADQFDIGAKFAEFMSDIGGSADDAGGKVSFVGSDPILRSHFRIGACMAIPAMAAGVGAASIWRERTGEEQNLSVDLRESIYHTNPLIKVVQAVDLRAGKLPKDDPIPASFNFLPTMNGKFLQAPLGIGNPFSFAIWDTKDDRKVTITGLYPGINDTALRVLGTPPDADSIRKAVKQFEAEELDGAMAKAGAVCAIHRTAEEWAEHPQGKYLASQKVIEIKKIGDADPIELPSNPEQPLSGIKTIAFTHVIAGSCAARTLAENGSQVLHIARDQSVEHDLIWQDVNVGMRSSFINLRQPEQKSQVEKLLPDANVFIESFRGRAIERQGLGVEEVARIRPGIVYLSLRCYGWEGPWRDRGGFDMEGLTATGYTMAEGGGKGPVFPPTMVLNDYIAGYLGAAGIMAALRRQSREGGSYHVQVSLSRAAMWYAGLGSFADPNDFDPMDPEHRMIDPETIKGQTCYGEVHRLGPQVKLSRTPGRYRDPLIVVRGSDVAGWI